MKTKKRYKVKEINPHGKARKSRRGKYIRIIDTKTGKIKTYKKIRGKKEEYYIELFKEKKKTRREKYTTGRGIKAIKKKTQLRERRIKRKALEQLYKSQKRIKMASDLGESIKKGQKRIVTSIEQLAENPREAYEQLLKPLVRSKFLVDILIENKEKLKHRIVYLTQIYGINDENQQKGKLAEIKDYNKTIEQFAEKYSQKFKRMNKTSKADLNETKTKLNWITHKDYFQGYETGTITHNWIEITFQGN